MFMDFEREKKGGREGGKKGRREGGTERERERERDFLILVCALNGD